MRVGNVRSSSYVCVRFFQQTCLLNAWCFTDSGESACNAGDASAIPASGRPPGGGHDNPLQYSCLENPMDRGAWRGTVHGVTKSQTNIHTYAHTYTCTHAHTHTHVCVRHCAGWGNKNKDLDKTLTSSWFSGQNSVRANTL